MLTVVGLAVAIIVSAAFDDFGPAPALGQAIVQAENLIEELLRSIERLGCARRLNAKFLWIDPFAPSSRTSYNSISTSIIRPASSAPAFESLLGRERGAPVLDAIGKEIVAAHVQHDTIGQVRRQLA